MTAPRTVTVETADHGHVTIPEPAWCIAPHDFEGYREDIEHHSAKTPLIVPTPCHGLISALPVFFVWRPFSETDSQMNVGIELDEWHEFSPTDLDKVAAALVEHARTIRVYARQLSTMRAGAK
ncbi:DUF6907 domain-containing protein [Streptomyces sp. NPDC058620]|uniref:DUF6907 domain-containing protein n=1 Tax=Streptomyces sp. NPDC058620 TaxID=3346560 RepID=UPI00364F5960